MTDVATRARIADQQSWPMTREARDRLVDEIALLRRSVAYFAGSDGDGAIHPPFPNAGRRLEVLLAVLDEAKIADGGGGAAIGRRVTVRGESGATTTYSIVFPGDGDPGRGWISADSPLGRAMLGARPGDTITVRAPIGTWSVTVVAVD